MGSNQEIEALLSKAWDLRRNGKYSQVLSSLKAASQICRDDDFYSQGRIFHIYMQIEADQDQPKKALELCKKSLLFYRKTKDPQRIAHSVRHVADLETRLKLYQNAEGHYLEALQIYRNHENSGLMDLANALRGYAILLSLINKKEEAILTWKEAKEIYLRFDIKLSHCTYFV